MTQPGRDIVTVIEEVARHFQSMVGCKVEAELGEVSAQEIRRYALTVEDSNPLYHDREYALARGYDDILAPPNMLPSIVEWGSGTAEEALLTDGNSSSNELIPLGDLQDVRVMGGGEHMTFHRMVPAGTRIKLTSTVVDTYTRQGRKGPLAFLVFENVYSDSESHPLCTCRRTLIAR